MSGTHQRWYDYDPTLLDVLTLLRNFQPEVREQAAVFLTKVEAAVGPEAMAEFSAQIEANPHKGKRWYDEDPVLYRAIELLRVLPPEIQHQAAIRFLEAMQRLGITHDVVQ